MTVHHREKRKYIRVEAFNLLKYKIVSTEGKQHEYKVSNVKDIGEGGLGFWTHEEMPVASLVELRINFSPFAVPISTLAKVIWVKRMGFSKQYKVGVQFVDIEKTFRKMIADKIVATHHK
jgi:c-di-GMP-binding flagellar brake protein YcgR